MIENRLRREIAEEAVAIVEGTLENCEKKTNQKESSIKEKSESKKELLKRLKEWFEKHPKSAAAIKIASSIVLVGGSFACPIGWGVLGMTLGYMTPATAALTWSAMGVGGGVITEKTVRDLLEKRKEKIKK